MASNENFNDSTNLVGFIYKNIKPILTITIVAAVISAIVSLFITNKFKSTEVLYPSNTSSISKALINSSNGMKGDLLEFGEEEKTEQLLQVLSSDVIRNEVIKKFDLMKHYEIDTASETKYSQLIDKFESNIKFRRNEYMAVEIIVLDESADSAAKMEEYIREIRKQGDTVGGVVTCVIQNVPVGLGEPVFDKLHAELGKAMLSINAVKGFEYGSGFSGVELRGSQHNDIIEKQADGSLRTLTNHSGGIQGGISNGEPIYFRVAFKPVATIMQDQDSVNETGDKITVSGKGRHDPCVVPRAVPIVEAMAAIVLLDFYLRNQVIQMPQK